MGIKVKNWFKEGKFKNRYVRCEDIHRVNLPLYACGARQLPPYQLLGSLEEFWMDT